MSIGFLHSISMVLRFSGVTIPSQEEKAFVDFMWLHGITWITWIECNKRKFGDAVPLPDLIWKSII